MGWSFSTGALSLACVGLSTNGGSRASSHPGCAAGEWEALLRSDGGGRRLRDALAAYRQALEWKPEDEGIEAKVQALGGK